MIENRQPNHRRRRPPAWFSLRRWLLIGILLWIAAAGLLVFDAKSRIDEARERIDRAVPAAKDGELDSVQAELVPGAADLRRARSDLTSPVLYPLRFLPVVGRQLDTARALAELGADAASEAEDLIALVDAPGSQGETSLQSLDLRAIEASVARMHALMVEPDLGPADGLVAPLADARAEVADLIAEYEPSIGKAAMVASGLRSFKEDSRYVLLGANNAEMQVGSGMVLSVGEVALTGDGVEFGGLESTEELFPVPKTDVVDADVDARWGFLQPTNDFRKLGVTPRFGEFVGPQAIEMWEAETGRRVDGAILVDAHALSRLLGVVGTVDIDGATYDEESLLDYLLVGQYAAFDSSDAGQALRRAKLSAVTSGVLDALVAGPHDLARLIDVVPSLLRGRHVLAFGQKDDEQRAWEALGAEGGETGHDLGVFVVNRGASKLDPYIDVEVAAAEMVNEDATVVELAITVRNEVTDGAALPTYVAGPWEWIDLDEPGDYLGRLVVELPGSTTDAEFLSNVPLEVFGPDGDGLVVGTRFGVGPGRSTLIRLRFEVPRELTSVSILPSARPRPIRWRWGNAVFDDREPVEQPLPGP